jgi:hypothetical protein
MSNVRASGIQPGQRRLNGPQTTGRNYRNLSEPGFEMTTDEDVTVPMRDGVALLADVHRPVEPGRYPVLVAASPYPRQIQNLGAPAGFIEAGASDFFVPRGYLHVIANCRGTDGSGGTWGFFDSQERRDMHNLIEWVAQQPWSNGNVGMIGISYFAGTQLEAAVERPPYLKAIMPVAGTFDLYESATHHGLMSSGFVPPFLFTIGLTSGQTNKLWRSKLLDAFRTLLLAPGIHKKFEMANGEAAISGLRVLLKLHHAPHPWDDLWRAIAVEHPFRDEWWEDRNLLPLLYRVEVPVYMGCDWQNVPLHLPHTFTALGRLTNSKHVQVAMMGEHGLSWPWESLHIEALARFDHWLKEQDTGILEGPRFRYILPESDDGWHTSEGWPIRETSYCSYVLGADGSLSKDEGEAGSRTYMNLGGGLNRPRPSETDSPGFLEWSTPPLTRDLDMIGPIELQLVATSTASDTAFIAVLQDVDENENAVNITAGYLRAGLRAVNESESKPGAPTLACRTFEAVPFGQNVSYRVPLVPNARRFRAGHKIRLYLTTDDQIADSAALLEFRHISIGTSSFNTVLSSSRLPAMR